MDPCNSLRRRKCVLRSPQEVKLVCYNLRFKDLRKSFKVAQNSFLFFFSRVIELGPIIQAWNCSVLNGCATFDLRISIFSHLTPRLQELLYLAKSFKEQGSYKYCWAKDNAVFLRKSDSSRVIRLNTVQDLEELRHSEAGRAASNQIASDSAHS